MRIVIIGLGKQGKRLKSISEDIGQMEIDEIKSLKEINHLNYDWALVCTPNIFHYEQTMFLLKKRINVFLEKPGSLTEESCRALFVEAKKNNVSLYVNDVFLHRSDKRLISEKISGTKKKYSFSWEKHNTNDQTSILYRLAYHDVQLFLSNHLDRINLSNINVISSNIQNSHFLNFVLSIDNYKVEFRYNVNLPKEEDPKHKVCDYHLNIEADNALHNLLKSVLYKQVSFKRNETISLATLKVIEFIKERVYKKVLVVGGGVFGVSSAIELSNAGYNVTLVEKNKSLLEETSSINQYRIHRGYHYPRSVPTASECQISYSEFRKSNSQSVSNFGEIRHHYSIAKKHSFINKDQYRKFLDLIELEYKETTPSKGCELTVKVNESLFDPVSLKKDLESRVFAAGVDVRFETPYSDFKEYRDFEVHATYSGNNLLPGRKIQMQFEVCEKPILLLPSKYEKFSHVIMDGPFMSLDPLYGTEYHVMGNVEHAIHASNTGLYPEVPDDIKPYLNKGVIKNPKRTNIDKFFKAAEVFYEDVHDWKYVGSMYTVRAILPNHEFDDSRPTLVEWADKNIVKVFSGKICTSTYSSKKVVELINKSCIKS